MRMTAEAYEGNDVLFRVINGVHSIYHRCTQIYVTIHNMSKDRETDIICKAEI